VLFNSSSLRAIALRILVAIVICAIGLVTLQPALAHHPMGERIPVNFFEGFLSGLGHPIIGLEHFAFVVAIGLLAVLRTKLGILIPLAFTVATGLGTLIHLQGVDLPIPEVIIALSVLTVGIVLTLKKNLNLILLIVLSAIAGIFHGFAYGEAILGAETTPLGAYLLGFAIVQLLISAIAFSLGSLTINNLNTNIKTFLPLRFAGCVIAGIGISFLSGALLG
jgi:urease accessory protein